MGLRQGDSDREKTGLDSAWLPAIAVTVIVLGLGGLGEPAREALAYHREGIAAGELWRLITGHLVHTGASHLALNLAALWLVWYLVGTTIGWRGWMLVWLLSIAAVDAGLWLHQPELNWYVGLSGVLHGLILAGVIIGLLSHRPELWLVAVAVIGKLTWEQIVGPLPGSEATTGERVIVDAHLYGAIAGILAGAILAIRVRARAPI